MRTTAPRRIPYGTHTGGVGSGFAVVRIAVWGALLLLCGLPSLRADVLTNAAQVLSLSAAQAEQRYPVQVKGVVTAAEPDWAGRFFVQDASSGVFVELISTNHPVAGDEVEVSGVTLPGAYAPIITQPTWRKTGTAPLPPGREVPIEDLMSGIEDGQRLTVTGVIRAIGPDPGTSTNFMLDLAAGGFRLPVITLLPAETDPARLVGAKVRVTGTAAAKFNATLRHLINVTLYVPRLEDLVIVSREAGDPFAEPTLPLNTIAQYQRNLLPGQRVHIRGVVTMQRPGEDFFLEDATGGLHVQSRQTKLLTVGEVVDVVGFPAFENYLPVLEDAIYRPSNEPGQTVKARPATMQEIQDGLHHADLVTLTAKVLDRTLQPGQLFSHRSWTQTTLLLQDNNQLFTAQAELPHGVTTLADIPIGSTIEVTGVCFAETDADQHLRSLKILLPDAAGVRILARPSWLTPGRLLIGLGILFAVLVVAVFWTVMVSQRNAALGRLVTEKEAAQRELQLAHDQLEDRVRERTAQLKFQISARKEAEVQFNATLQERTRLAQELHDTLEQTLTGIALQLDTTSKLFQTKPQAASHHLELARDQVALSQVEVRRSIWNLRSRALEQFDLPSALVTSSKQLTEGTEVRIEVTTKGRVRPLPEIVEDNLLRISQEAMTNIVKHSRATAAEVILDYGAQNILLRISDNGRGFAAPAAGPAEGHFGLLGMAERVKRLNAELDIKSTPGAGTQVRVQVPLERAEPHEAAEL